MTRRDTKERILDAAEAVFAEHGFAGASLRAITGLADVNLASVSYHFGSKERLYRDMFQRRIESINRERIEALDRLEAEAGEDPVPVEALVRGFVEPAFLGAREWGQSGEQFLRIAGRMFSEPGDHWRRVVELFGDVRLRYMAALRRSLPDHTVEDVVWRLHFVVGLMCHTLSSGPLLEVLSEGRCRADDPEETLAQLVPFLAAGMTAPSPSRRVARGVTR